MTADVPTDAPALMDHLERSRLRSAAFRVTRLYPGPVGELLSRELLMWEEFGYRLGGNQLIMRLVDHVLKAPLAAEAEQAQSRREDELRREAESARAALAAHVAFGCAAQGGEKPAQPPPGASNSRPEGPDTGRDGWGSLAALWAAHRARNWGHTASEAHQ